MINLRFFNYIITIAFFADIRFIEYVIVLLVYSNDAEILDNKSPAQKREKRGNWWVKKCKNPLAQWGRWFDNMRLFNEKTSLSGEKTVKEKLTIDFN